MPHKNDRRAIKWKNNETMKQSRNNEKSGSAI